MARKKKKINIENNVQNKHPVCCTVSIIFLVLKQQEIQYFMVIRLSKIAVIFLQMN